MSLLPTTSLVLPTRRTKDRHFVLSNTVALESWRPGTECESTVTHAKVSTRIILEDTSVYLFISQD